MNPWSMPVCPYLDWPVLPCPYMAGFTCPLTYFALIDVEEFLTLSGNPPKHLWRFGLTHPSRAVPFG